MKQKKKIPEEQKRIQNTAQRETEKNTVQNKKAAPVVSGLLLFGITGFTAGAASYLYGRNTLEIERNVALLLAGAGALIYLQAQSRIDGQLDYDNALHPFRFLFIYLTGLAGAAFFPMMPVGIWPFLAVFVSLSLFGNAVLGVASGSLLLLFTVLLRPQGAVMDFALYFISGLVGIVLFRQIEEEFRVGIPTFLSLLCLMVSLTAGVILTDNERLSLESMLLPAFNLFISLILLLVVLKYFSYTVIHKDRDRYLEINDQEFPPLAELKNISREDYLRVIHTAYLSDRIAGKLTMDVPAARACAYYHRIGVLKGANTWENVRDICEQYRFPHKARKLLRECVDETAAVVSGEAAVVLVADAVVSAFVQLFADSPDTNTDYRQVVEQVFDRELGSGAYDDNVLTLAQLKQMKQIFLEEKLYYDFLR